MNRNSAPRWMRKAMEVIAQSVKPLSIMGPMGWNWAEPETSQGHWELAVYPTPSEIYRGPMDGTTVNPGYQWNLNKIFAMFDSTPRVAWTTPTERRDKYLGAEIDICGAINDEPVWLRLFNTPPSDERASIVFDTVKRKSWPNDKAHDTKKKSRSRNDFRDEDPDEIS